MAKLTALPEKAIIDKLKGKIDFYYWRGIPVARRWPVHKPRWRSPQERATQQDLADVMHLRHQISQTVLAAYRALPCAKYLTWRDWLVKAYIAGIDYHGRFRYWEEGIREDPKIQLLSYTYTIEEPDLHVITTTNLPCDIDMNIAFTPPAFVQATHERRGLLLRILDIIYLWLIDIAHQSPPYFQTQHHTWFSLDDLGPHNYFTFDYIHRYDPYTLRPFYAPSRSPIFEFHKA